MPNGELRAEIDIAARVRALMQRLEAESHRFGRPPALLAVTKEHSAEEIWALKETPLRLIGESRVQDWEAKKTNLLQFFTLHWIGRLQTNKIRYIIDTVCLVHSLDRPSLAEAIDGAGRAIGRRVPVLVQVNIAQEPQKAGVAPDELEPFLRQYAQAPGLSVQGLMAIMPQAEDPERLRPYFREMRARFEALQRQTIPGVQMNELSMGMSSDCFVAASEGATIVRVGSAIFGPRV